MMKPSTPLLFQDVFLESSGFGGEFIMCSPPCLDVVDIPNGIVFQKRCCFGILPQLLVARSDDVFFSEQHIDSAKVAIRDDKLTLFSEAQA